ncbi:MAG: GntR family transcriptional regulator [Rhodospirillales bacterium]|nr:GntR family transcriptional regulator [Rhodospirillales bacterium]
MDEPGGALALDDPNGVGSLSRPLYEVVCGVLREQIAISALEPGLVLRENDIVTVFGVGRAPARMALRTLEDEGLIRKLRGRGYCVGGRGGNGGAKGRFLVDVPLELPPTLGLLLEVRNWRQQIYPAVERAVASCLIFGRFQINQSALAEHFGVSRTIAHEVLTSLEKVGFVHQESNARWYAGPMTLLGFKERYEIRRLLEPAALIEAAPRISKDQFEGAREQVVLAREHGAFDPETLDEIELALHTDIVLKCENEQMRAILRTCQLPLLVTYGTVVASSATFETREGIPETLAEHQKILELLIAGKIKKAASKLETHIRHGLQWGLPHFSDPRPLAPEKVPSYMHQIS